MDLLTEIRKDYSIRLVRHKLKFCRIYPVTDLDEVILELLNLHKGHLEFKDLGALLGFAVFDVPSENIHYDKAEVTILEDLLETLQRYHLITVGPAANDQREIQCTQWGRQALINKEKRLFFEGTITLPEHYLIEITKYENAHFPFKKFGVEAVIENPKESDPFELNDLSNEGDTLMLLASNNLDDTLIEKQQIELSEIKSEIIGYHEKHIHITISLYGAYDSHMLTSAINGVPSLELDELINPSSNVDVYHNWLLEARYQYYLESSKELSSEGLTEFSSVVDWQKLLDDRRLIWNNKLLELLSDEEIASSQIWTIVSENAPSELITSNIFDHRNLWNWFRLSERLPFSFILEHANDYDWDFDALASRIGSHDIQCILEVLDDNNRISDWSQVTEMVTFKFLKENLRKYPWDFHLVTNESISGTAQLILENLDLDWDWSFIASNWPPSIIIDNYEKLLDKLNLKSFITRLLKDENEFQTVIGSNYHMDLLNKTLSGSGITFSTVDDIILNETTLTFLDNNNLLFWGEGHISGIEAHPNLLWVESIFQKYHHKVKSEKGFTNVSSSIPNLEIIESNPAYPWDFTVISKRKDLNWNIEFIETYKESLPPQNLLTHLSANLVSNNIWFFIHWLSQLEKLELLGKFISQYFSFSQIKMWANLLVIHEVRVNWGSVLHSYSEKMLADIAIELHEGSVSLPFHEDLNSFLTRNCSLVFILENPDLTWNWKYLTENRLDESQLNNEEFRFEYAEHLYWPYILENIISVEDLNDIDVLNHLAEDIFKAPDDIIKGSWQIITSKIPRHKLWEFIPKTENIVVFQWDWDLISSMNKLDITHDFLNSYRENLNWCLLSKNPYLHEFFRYDESAYKNKDQWRKRCRKYLDAFQYEWDFIALSHIENLTWNVSIVSEFKERWDWKVLSSTSKVLTKKNKKTDKTEFIPARLKQFSKYIYWDILSTRHEVTITTDLLSKFAEKAWDWSALSAHPKFEITHEFLRGHIEKTWDYNALTDHPKLNLNKKLLLELAERDWNFAKLSSKPWIDNDIVLTLENRQWDWSLVSKNKSIIPDLNLLRVFEDKDDINWRSIVKNPNLHLTLDTVKILNKQREINENCWNILSNHKKLDFREQPDLLYKYRNFWDWQSLVKGKKFDINELELLDKYKNYLDWSYISKSHDIQFTPELIEEFKLNWDYFELKENISLSYNARLKVNDIIQEIPELGFYFKIKEQNSYWSGRVYHFTHIDNAVKIIKDEAIKSRKTANQLSDSAGKSVESRTDPYKFARFYFRPHTQTQFYNEFLGIDTDMGYNKNGKWHSWYKHEYRNEDYPKCPNPVYFEFDLQEIVLKVRQYCQISTGNMQRKKTAYGTILRLINRFNFQDVFIRPGYDADMWIRYHKFAQQELLILDQLDFKNLNYIKIICSSTEDKDLFRTLLGDEYEKFANRVFVDPSYYRWKNPSIEVVQMGNKTKISSKKKADGHFVLSSANFDSIKILDGNFINNDCDKIRFESNIEFIDNGQNCSCFYIDEIGRKWLIYSNNVLHIADS